MGMDAIRQYVLAMKGVQDTPDAVRFCEHFLQVAAEFKTVNWEVSKDFAKISSGELQMCFENCQVIAAQLPVLQYFEGFVVSRGESVAEHVWLVGETGEVIDPTLVLRTELKERVEGYMGVEIPIDYIKGLYREDAWRDRRIEQAFADGQW